MPKKKDENLEFNQVLDYIREKVIGTRKSSTSFIVQDLAEALDITVGYAKNICNLIADLNYDIVTVTKLKDGRKVKHRYKLLKPRDIRWPTHEQYKAAYSSENDTPGNKTGTIDRLYAEIKNDNQFIIYVKTNTPRSFVFIERLFKAFKTLCKEETFTPADLATQSGQDESTAKKFIYAMLRMFPDYVIRTTVNDDIMIDGDEVTILHFLRGLRLVQISNGEKVEKRPTTTHKEEPQNQEEDMNKVMSRSKKKFEAVLKYIHDTFSYLQRKEKQTVLFETSKVVDAVKRYESIDVSQSYVASILKCYALLFPESVTHIQGTSNFQFSSLPRRVLYLEMETCKSKGIRGNKITTPRRMYGSDKDPNVAILPTVDKTSVSTVRGVINAFISVLSLYPKVSADDVHKAAQIKVSKSFVYGVINALCRIFPHVFRAVANGGPRNIQYECIDMAAVNKLYVKVEGMNEQFKIASVTVSDSHSNNMLKALKEAIVEVFGMTKNNKLNLSKVRKAYNGRVTENSQFKGDLREFARLLKNQLDRDIVSVIQPRNLSYIQVSDDTLAKLVEETSDLNENVKTVEAPVVPKDMFEEEDLLPNIDDSKFRLPKIFVFPKRAQFPTIVYALAEDGELLKMELMSNEEEMKRKFGMFRYNSKYPYQIFFVSASEVYDNEGLIEAYQKHLARKK